MTNKPAIQSLKEINAEFSKLYSSEYKQTRKRLKECVGDEEFTPVDSFKVALESFAHIALVRFFKPTVLGDESEFEYQQKGLIFEDKLRDLGLSYLNINMLETNNTYEPELGYLVWDDNPNIEDSVLFKAIDDWNAKYENIQVNLFQYDG